MTTYWIYIELCHQTEQHSIPLEVGGEFCTRTATNEFDIYNFFNSTISYDKMSCPEPTFKANAGSNLPFQTGTGSVEVRLVACNFSPDFPLVNIFGASFLLLHREETRFKS